VSLPESPLLTVAEAAAYLRASPDTVRRWVAAGQLRPWRPDGRGRGKLLYIHVNELKRFAERVEELPATAPEAPPPSVRGKAALSQAGWDGDAHRTRGKAGRPRK
jgi:excisionase family DNA binding protein